MKGYDAKLLLGEKGNKIKLIDWDKD